MKEEFTIDLLTMLEFMSYLNTCGCLAQRLYYKHSDTTLFNDYQYDKLVQRAKELKKLYPRCEGVVRFDEKVGH